MRGLVVAGSIWGQSGDPGLLFQHAIQLQQAGDYTGAVSVYREFLAVRPDEVSALSNLGVVLGKLGRYDDAIAEYEKADKLDRNDSRIILNIALAYAKSGRPFEAKEKLEWLHATSPQDHQITLLLADTCLQLGRSDTVIQLLEPLKNSDDLAVDYMLGTALLRSKRISEGQVLLDRILSRGDSAEARFLLATRMFESGDYPAAVKQFASAAALNAELPDLQSYYGQALLFTGDPDGAMQAFQKALTISGSDYRAHLGMGEILVERKRYQESLPFLEQAVLLRPQAREAAEQLGHALLSLGRLGEAREKLESAERLGGESVQLHEDLSTLYSRLKLRDEALREHQLVTQAKTKSEPEAGPRIHEDAPRFVLAAAGGGKEVKLEDFRGKSAVVLVFGSYSCPNFRDAAAELERLYTRYGSKIAFLLVYIREAHTQQDWESTRNVKEQITVPAAATMPEKREHALMCSRKLHLNFPAVIDDLDGRVENAYAAWPSRTVLVGLDGRVLYSTRLTELDFHAEELEAQLKKLR